jgi:PAS domain S-box-containing protein
LRAVVDNSADGIMSTDESGVIETFNPACEKLFGFEAREVVGRNIRILMSPDVGENHGRMLEKYLQQEDRAVFNHEVEGVRRDGRVFPLQISVAEMCLHDRRGFNAILRDITTQKMAEKVLHEAAERLKMHNAELQKSNRELENYAYMVSHDLKEPLRMVRSYCELLQERYSTVLGEKGREFIHYAVDGAERMQFLIRDLLAYSHVSRDEILMEEVNLGEVVEAIARVLRPLMEETGATLVVDGELPTVVAEKVMMQQLLQNLIGNGLKFHKPGEAAEVHVAARGERNCWEIEIRDNGVGIEPRHHRCIFEMFKRLHSRDTFDGTGIGLAICKRIVERHGGKITVDSRPGEGATFTVTLPRLAVLPRRERVETAEVTDIQEGGRGHVYHRA